MQTYKLTNGKKLEVFQDEYPQNPRHDDNLSTMICFHGKYKLGDKNDYDHKDYDSWAEMRNAIIENENPAVILPLYLYDHSGITISTNPFSCKWDSGQIGWVFISEDKVKKEYGVTNISNELLNKVTTILLNEVDTYDQYLTGEVYGYTLLDENNNIEDSCSGYFGSDIKKNGILDSIGAEILG